MIAKSEVLIMFVVTSSIGFVACKSGENEEKPPVTVYGKATYYSDWFQGKTTANGEIFHQDSFTAATKDTIPFGTIIRVTNLNNDSVVTVRVNDRIGSRYSIDLTTVASKQLNMREEGVVPVKMELLNYRELMRQDSLEQVDTSKKH